MLKLIQAQICDATLKSGEISVIAGNLVVGCGDSSAIALLRVLPAGKKEMSGIEWSRGLHVHGGEHCD